MKKSTVIIFSAILLSINVFAQQYKVSKKISVAGDGGWDYLVSDDETDRLFISHGTVVNVVNAKDGSSIESIPNTIGVHGIALANDLNKGFISCGKDTSIVVFDLKTLKTLVKVKIAGLNPDAILYDQFSKKVFIYNGSSSDATVMDAITNAVVATIPFGGKPEYSVTNGKGLVYVNIEDKNEIKVINATTLKVEKTWSISPGEEPTGLALDKSTNRLFAVCGNKLMIVVNAENGKVITTLPIGDGCDGVFFDSEKKLIFSSNGEGTVTIVKEENENEFKVIETVTTQKGARTITLNSKTHQLFLPTAEYGEKPAPTKEKPNPRPGIKPNSFLVLVLEQ